MADRRYRITVWYLTREHMLGGVAVANVGLRRPAHELIWEFVASGPPPPDDRTTLWRVLYVPKEREPVIVTLDMRFVREVVPAGRKP